MFPPPLSTAPRDARAGLRDAARQGGAGRAPPPARPPAPTASARAAGRSHPPRRSRPRRPPPSPQGAMPAAARRRLLRTLCSSTFRMGDWASRLPLKEEALPGRNQRIPVAGRDDFSHTNTHARPPPAAVTGGGGAESRSVRHREAAPLPQAGGAALRAPARRGCGACAAGRGWGACV